MPRGARTAQLHSAMLGAWPGRVDSGGRLPAAWLLINPGIVVEVIDTNTDRGIDYVEVRMHGAPTGTAPLEFQMGRPQQFPAAQGDTIETALWMAAMDGTRQGITKIVFGLNFFSAAGAYLGGEWLTQDFVLGRDREMRRFTESFGPIAQVIGSVVPKIGIYLVQGLPMDFTLRFGWSRCIVTTP